MEVIDDDLSYVEETPTGTEPAHPDTDEDGAIGGIDASWLIEPLDEIPNNDFRRRILNPTMRLTVLAAAIAVSLGDAETALAITRSLHSRIDCCGTSPDRNDWIIDCSAQVGFRDLLALYERNAAALRLPDPLPWRWEDLAPADNGRHSFVGMKLLVPIAILVLAGCSANNTDDTTTSSVSAVDSTFGTSPTINGQQEASSTYGVAPAIPDDPPTTEVEAAVDRLLTGVYTPDWDIEAIGDLADLGDARTAWLLADLMRFYQTGIADEELVSAFSRLTGADQDSSEVSFVWAMNHLIAWDLPAWAGYAGAKRAIYTPVEDLWQRFFDENVGLDWRLVTWGGVLADQRPLDDSSPCNCIPALDHPDTTDAAGGEWYADDRIVFGVVVNDEAMALPKHQMEVHEMVNLTLGGRELGVPYCTLCASAQAYYVDDVPAVERVVLRTSGLLKRSNKLMYDLTTGSAIDTFTGDAVTGPLAEDGVTLEQVSVVAAPWGDWKETHPDTRILAQDGGIGRSYQDDPLGARDDGGPIFPVGPVDPRLPVQEKVVGVISPDGTPVAFPLNTTTAALADGPIDYEGLTVRLEDSIRVYDSTGEEVVSHGAFWFAWSQFHPNTTVWDPVGS